MSSHDHAADIHLQLDNMMRDMGPLVTEAGGLTLSSYVRGIRESLNELAPSAEQISVEYTCCGGQEFWPLNANGDLEMTHAEMGVLCDGITRIAEQLSARSIWKAQAREDMAIAEVLDKAATLCKRQGDEWTANRVRDLALAYRRYAAHADYRAESEVGR